MKLKSGKYIDQEIATVPQSYLLWLMKNVHLPEEIAAEVGRIYWGRVLNKPDITATEAAEHARTEMTRITAEMRVFLRRG